MVQKDELTQYQEWLSKQQLWYVAALLPGAETMIWRAEQIRPISPDRDGAMRMRADLVPLDGRPRVADHPILLARLYASMEHAEAALEAEKEREHPSLEGWKTTT
jgi:hypothetical protein